MLNSFNLRNWINASCFKMKSFAFSIIKFPNLQIFKSICFLTKITFAFRIPFLNLFLHQRKRRYKCLQINHGCLRLVSPDRDSKKIICGAQGTMPPAGRVAFLFQQTYNKSQSLRFSNFAAWQKPLFQKDRR